MGGRYAAALPRSIQIRPRLCGFGRIRTACQCCPAKCGCSPHDAHWAHRTDELCSALLGSTCMSDKAEPRTRRPKSNALPSFEMADTTSVCPRHVRRALAYLRQHFTQKVTLADVAAAAGTSERTLRRNFARFVGLAPLAYLRHLRLAAVRNELSQGEDAISRIAARYGFTHFGRFAMAYRECFGETPSAACRIVRRDSQDLINEPKPGNSKGALPPHNRVQRGWLRSGDEPFSPTISASSLPRRSADYRSSPSGWCRPDAICLFSTTRGPGTFLQRASFRRPISFV